MGSISSPSLYSLISPPAGHDTQDRQLLLLLASRASIRTNWARPHRVSCEGAIACLITSPVATRGVDDAPTLSTTDVVERVMVHDLVI